jgi:hypothetical protein
LISDEKEKIENEFLNETCSLSGYDQRMKKIGTEPIKRD